MIVGDRRSRTRVGARGISPGGRPGRSPDEERRLIQIGLLPGVDFCTHAVELNSHGRVVRPEHQAACAVCLRRWRVTEAELQGWQSLTHDGAERIVPDMAADFASAERDERYRPFYAHLARCAECERRLAELTFDQTLSTPDRELLTAARRPAP